MAAARATRPKRQANAIGRGKLVESTNSLSATTFFSTYFAANTLNTLTTVCGTHGFNLVCEDSAGMEEVDMDVCFRLIELSSAEDYHNSEIKWSPSKKKREMALPDMKYIALFESASKLAVGFVSFMVTYEDGYEVVYIYEIHFVPTWQQKGLGKLLMNAVENIARSVGVKKIMLTVFRANDKAVKWYDHLGYSVDEFSPEPRRMRNGTIKESSYLILSKMLR